VLKANVSKRHPTTMDELEQIAMEEWEKIDQERENLIRNLME
jgi:hypothetical protein